MKALRATLVTIGLFQLVLGALFVVAPTQAHVLFRLTPAEPAWADWLMVMTGARFLGFAYGMYLAARNPFRHVAWINAMIVIQAIDWATTLGHLVTGELRLSQATTAAFMPPLFVIALLWFHPRRMRATTPSTA